MAVAITLLLLLFYPYAYFSVPTASMAPTMKIGDVVAVDRMAWGIGRHHLYRLGIVLPLSQPTGRLRPQRGDLAAFKIEYDDDVYIKRIVGLPDDRVQMREGRLYVNGEMILREFVRSTYDTDSTGATVPVEEYVEHLTPQISYSIFEVSDDQQFDNTPEYIVPPDSYFVVGDNRDRSVDSRGLVRIGFIAVQDLVGRVVLR